MKRFMTALEIIFYFLWFVGCIFLGMVGVFLLTSGFELYAYATFASTVIVFVCLILGIKTKKKVPEYNRGEFIKTYKLEGYAHADTKKSGGFADIYSDCISLCDTSGSHFLKCTNLKWTDFDSYIVLDKNRVCYKTKSGIYGIIGLGSKIKLKTFVKLLDSHEIVDVRNTENEQVYEEDVTRKLERVMESSPLRVEG